MPDRISRWTQWRLTILVSGDRNDLAQWLLEEMEVRRGVPDGGVVARGRVHGFPAAPTRGEVYAALEEALEALRDAD